MIENVTSTWRGLKNFTLQRKVVDFVSYTLKMHKTLPLFSIFL